MADHISRLDRTCPQTSKLKHEEAKNEHGNEVHASLPAECTLRRPGGRPARILRELGRRRLPDEQGEDRRDAEGVLESPWLGRGSRSRGDAISYHSREKEEHGTPCTPVLPVLPGLVLGVGLAFPRGALHRDPELCVVQRVENYLRCQPDGGVSVTGPCPGDGRAESSGVPGEAAWRGRA